MAAVRAGLVGALFVFAASCSSEMFSEPLLHQDPQGCDASRPCSFDQTCSPLGLCGPPAPEVAPGRPFYFGAFGDCLRAQGALQYPTPIVSNIFRQLADKHVQFVAMVGDYVYQRPPSYEGAKAQLNEFLESRALYPGPVYFALGNHDAEPETVRAFTELLSPALYFSVSFPGALRPEGGLSTVKLVFVADNAWGPTQAQWLRQVLSEDSDYTFVIRHHTTTTALDPEVAEIIGAASPKVTLVIAGHVHAYKHLANREVLTGNGGAPVYDGAYGYLTIEQLPEGGIEVKSFDQATNLAIDSFVLSAG